ncbi:hypothetical protein L6270_01545 [Candidatus Parcubacteria bacterium]|nr:hypothetical protein [Patescibacteria group bacterium]MBU4309824.1 hypothetical protein [Patescibacteria group bacterium]MBU4432580.1 hypothetical protein [Patescibacteria group bacterium]MBU4578163.1 hypothetical protein [Patescibacteria group bacterium]MCG2696700.1 hypothetical protein [Candidatus Parcubacteria bacterium]
MKIVVKNKNQNDHKNMINLESICVQISISITDQRENKKDNTTRIIAGSDFLVFNNTKILKNKDVIIAVK